METVAERSHTHTPERTRIDAQQAVIKENNCFSFFDGSGKKVSDKPSLRDLLNGTKLIGSG